MNSIKALEALHEDLALSGQSEDRRNKVVQDLTKAINECLDVFSGNKRTPKKTVDLYECEVLAAQHFLTQFGLHLWRLPSGCDEFKTKQPWAYAVFPNWK